MKDFLITGCGRSGTKYTATLLSRLGCDCGHERLFHPGSLRVTPRGQFQLTAATFSRKLLDEFRCVSANATPSWRPAEDGAVPEQDPDQLFAPRFFYREQDLKVCHVFSWPRFVFGESSWLAAPYLEALPTGTTVLHQVRDPLLVVRSWVRVRLFERPVSVYRDFIEEHCPDLRLGTSIERAMKYWVEWNRLAQRAESMPHLRYFRYRLEDLDAALLGRLFSLIDFDCSLETIEAALRSQPRNVNTRGSKQQDYAIRWNSLPNPVLRREFRELAGEYGLL